MSETYYDRKGIPIWEGDVLKIYHYTSPARRERRYMYKLAVKIDGAFYCVHINNIPEHGIGKSNAYRMSLNDPNEVEIVAGLGYPPSYDFKSRTRKKKVAKE